MQKNSFKKVLKTLGLFIGLANMMIGGFLHHSAIAENTSEISDDSDALPKFLIEIPASDKFARSTIANLGFAIEETLSDKVFIYGDQEELDLLTKAGFRPTAYPFDTRWLEIESNQYTDYDQVLAKMQALAAQNPNFVSYSVIGSSHEGRDIPLLRISNLTPPQAQLQQIPSIFYMGCHHAREHLSVEIPLMFAEYVVQQAKTNPYFQNLIATRELFIAPMINPDGHVWDRSRSGFRMWRKNRRFIRTGLFGVDLNRNYGYMWGTGGSSSMPKSDVYMGPAPFSEPESQAVRDFVLTQRRMTTMISFHTFSELVLYPWGHTFDPISKPLDRQIFQKMARDMARWNNYKPQQSSDLYIASGDTTDWAYGELGIYAFTFELSPKRMGQGGFYPGDRAIAPTFQANLKPMTYLMEFADRPERVLSEDIPDFNFTPARKGIAIADPMDLRF